MVNGHGCAHGIFIAIRLSLTYSLCFIRLTSDAVYQWIFTNFDYKWVMQIQYLQYYDGQGPNSQMILQKFVKICLTFQAKCLLN